MKSNTQTPLELDEYHLTRVIIIWSITPASAKSAARAAKKARTQFVTQIAPRRPSHLGGSGSHGTRRRSRKNPSADAKELAGRD